MGNTRHDVDDSRPRFRVWMIWRDVCQIVCAALLWLAVDEILLYTGMEDVSAITDWAFFAFLISKIFSIVATFRID